MPKEIPSNENILIKTFFRGHFDIVPEAILIVVGTWIGAERYDRILAQLIKRILTNLNIEADIMTDTYYNEKIEKYGKNPMICIGSTNYITKKHLEEGDFGLKDRETTAKVFTENEPLIAFIYGGGVKETYEATMDFCKNKLIIFLEKWSALYAGGKKKIEIPSNINELLNEIIFTMPESGEKVPLSLLLDGYKKKEDRMKEKGMHVEISPHIEVNPTMTQKTKVKTNIEINLNVDLPAIKTDFDDLKGTIAHIDPELKEELDKIEDSLDEVSVNTEKEELNKPLNKLGRFLQKLEDKNSKYHKIVSSTKKGIELAQKLGKTYNKFAQWLALPQVPDLFLGK